MLAWGPQVWCFSDMLDVSTTTYAAGYGNINVTVELLRRIGIRIEASTNTEKIPKPSIKMQDELTIRELKQVPSITVYKIIAGLDTSLHDYNEKCHQEARNNVQQSDWRALYTQFQRQHVLGTLPYRWEQATHATLVEVTFQNLDILVMDGPFLYSGHVSGERKASIIKEKLGITSDKALMHELGNQGKAALIRETEHEWELVISHEWVDRMKRCDASASDVESHDDDDDKDETSTTPMYYSERVVAQFERHPTMPITRRWRVGGGSDSSWQRWNDENDASIVDCIPDLSMAWMDR